MFYFLFNHDLADIGFLAMYNTIHFPWNHLDKIIYSRPFMLDVEYFFYVRKKCMKAHIHYIQEMLLDPVHPHPPFACCSLEYDRPTPSLILLEIWWYFNAWLRNKIEIELDLKKKMKTYQISVVLCLLCDACKP